MIISNMIKIIHYIQYIKITNIIHTQCPKCASLGKDNHKDNLAIYPNNSKYCFSCGYYQSGNNSYVKPTTKTYKLPYDSNISFPIEYCSYLNKYLTKYEISHNLIIWSNTYNRLIFPIINQNSFIGRSLTEKPKWKFYGQKQNLIYLLGRINSNTIIITEDIISAIIVGRQNICTLPIFGTHISTTLLQKLKNKYNKTKFILWLDKDKEATSLNYYYKFKQLNFNISYISTNKDPKEYSNEEIRIILENVINNKTTM